MTQNKGSGVTVNRIMKLSKMIIPRKIRICD